MSHLNEACQLYKISKKHEKNGQLEKAAEHLEKAIQIYESVLDSYDESIRISLSFLLEFLNEKFEILKDAVDQDLPVPHNEEISTIDDEESLSGKDEAVGHNTCGATVEVESLVKWPKSPLFSDLIGMYHAKSSLAAQLFRHDPNYKHLFHFSKSQNDNILLYGYSEPGTGKSKLAYAFASESGFPLIELKPSDLLSRWIGEGENKLKKVFELASKKQPCLVFIDEIDGLFGGMEKSENRANLINEFLLLAERHANVQVLAATNFPWNLHESVRRRFQSFIHVPLPKRQERERIMEYYLRDTGVVITKADMFDLGKQTFGYSGSDLQKLVSFVLNIPWCKVQNATHFMVVDKNGSAFWRPCFSNDPGAKEISFSEIPGCQIERSEITKSDFLFGLQNVKKTVNPEDANGKLLQDKMRDFTKKFGAENI